MSLCCKPGVCVIAELWQYHLSSAEYCSSFLLFNDWHKQKWLCGDAAAACRGTSAEGVLVTFVSSHAFTGTACPLVVASFTKQNIKKSLLILAFPPLWGFRNENLCLEVSHAVTETSKHIYYRTAHITEIMWRCGHQPSSKASTVQSTCATTAGQNISPSSSSSQLSVCGTKTDARAGWAHNIWIFPPFSASSQRLKCRSSETGMMNQSRAFSS